MIDVAQTSMAAGAACAIAQVTGDVYKRQGMIECVQSLICFKIYHFLPPCSASGCFFRTKKIPHTDPVSYTHLDVYKRQVSLLIKSFPAFPEMPCFFRVCHPKMTQIKL